MKFPAESCLFCDLACSSPSGIPCSVALTTVASMSLRMIFTIKKLRLELLQSKAGQDQNSLQRRCCSTVFKAALACTGAASEWVGHKAFSLFYPGSQASPEMSWLLSAEVKNE